MFSICLQYFFSPPQCKGAVPKLVPLANFSVYMDYTLTANSTGQTCSCTPLLYSQINQQHGSHYHDKSTEGRIEVYNAQKNRCSGEGVHPVQPVPVEVLLVHYRAALRIHLNIWVHRSVFLDGYVWRCCRLMCRSMFRVYSLGNCRCRWLSAGSYLG